MRKIRVHTGPCGVEEWGARARAVYGADRVIVGTEHIYLTPGADLENERNLAAEAHNAGDFALARIVREGSR